MYQTRTLTASLTNTFTEARARKVMESVFDDFVSMAMSGVVTFERVKGWEQDLTKMLVLEALRSFQVQFTKPAGGQIGIEFEVSDDGTLTENSPAGGVNYHQLPKGTTTSIVLDLRPDAKKKPEALDYLKERGWGFNGALLKNVATRDRAYSMEGYGVLRKKIGGWS